MSPRTGSATLTTAIVKLLDHAIRYAKVDAPRCGETIAHAFDRSGNTDAAQTIRTALAAPKPRVTYPGGRREDGAVEWIDPLTEGEVEFVRDDACGHAVEALALELESADRYIAHGIDAPTRILFHGPSGVGKTLAARWLGHRLGLPVALVRLDQAIDSHLGETSKKLKACIETAASCPSILFLDEIDGLCGRRDGGGDQEHSEMRRVTSSLLQQIDLLPAGQVVIAATNFPDHVDPALRRRLATEIEFGPPSRRARAAMIGRWWRQVEMTTAAVAVMLDGSDGMSGATLRSWAMTAARVALREGVMVEARHVTATSVGLTPQPAV